MKKYKILILDSQETIEKYYSNFINNSEYDVTFISDVNLLFNNTEHEHTHLIIVDLVHFRNHYESIVQYAREKNTYIICASSFKNVGDLNLDKSIRILNKPFKDIDLRITVKSVLAKHYS